MPRFIRSLFLPAAFFLLFTAEECESPNQVEEEISVLSDGSVEVALQHKARDLERILDSDPPPSLETGWDSVHVGLMRENGDDKYYLRAWTRFPSGADLPGSYARPGDPLSEWYVQFPSTLVREEREDTLIFHYRRTYRALPWSPMGLMETLEEGLESGDAEMNAIFEEQEGVMEEKWESTGALDEAKESEDSATLRRYQQEVRDLLEAGDPPVIERAKRLIGDWMVFMTLNDLAFAIPAGEQVCREANPARNVAVTDFVLEVLRESEAPVDIVWALMLDELNFDPDPSVFPEVSGEEFDPWDDGIFEEESARMLGEVRETLFVECGLSAEGLIEFDRRFAWLSERYRISDGEIRDQAFRVYLSMPGDLVETNADTIANGRAEWSFSIRELFEKEITLTATSRSMGENP